MPIKSYRLIFSVLACGLLLAATLPTIFEAQSDCGAPQIICKAARNDCVTVPPCLKTMSVMQVM